MELTPGANAALAGETIEVNVRSGKAADVSAYQLYANGKVKQDSDMVFYGQKNNANGTICLLETGCLHKFIIKLNQLAQDVEKVAFAVTCDAGESITKLGSLTIEVGGSTGRAQHTGSVNLANRTEAALILGEVYRRSGQWKFRFVAQGFAGGLQPLAEHFGVEIAESAPAASQTQPKPSQAVAPHASNSGERSFQSKPNGQQAPAVVSSKETGSDSNQSDQGASASAAQSTETAPNPWLEESTTRTRSHSQMSFFDKVKKAIGEGRDELANQVGRFKNKKFMEGTVAICAVVAMASDGVSAEEKQKMVAFIKNSPELKVFETADVIEFFNKVIANFDFDHDIGKGEAMKFIVRLKETPDAAQLALRVGIAVAKSDGDFDAQEKEAAREICVALGLTPADYDL